MALNLANADAVLKDLEGALREQLNSRQFMLNQFAKNSEDVEGRRVYHPVHVGRNSGVASISEEDDLPEAGNQQADVVYLVTRYHVGRIQLTVPTIEAMSSDRGSFVRAIRYEARGLVDDMSANLNRQVFGTSDGVIAATGVTTASTTVQLAASTTATQMRHLWNDGGMRVDIGTVANPTAVASNRRVLSYNPTALTITIDGAPVTTAATHRVFRAGSGGGPGTTGMPGDGQRELTGLRHIVDDDSALHTIDPSTQPVWAAFVDSNGGVNRAISETLVNRAIHQTEIRSGEQVDILVGSAGVSRAAVNLLTSQRRTVNRYELRAGASGVEWSTPAEGAARSSPVVLAWDRDCPENTLFGLSSGQLVEYSNADWSWMTAQNGQGSGTAVLFPVSGKLAYQAVLYKFNEVGTYKRNAHFRIDDLIEA